MNTTTKTKLSIDNQLNDVKVMLNFKESKDRAANLLSEEFLKFVDVDLEELLTLMEGLVDYIIYTKLTFDEITSLSQKRIVIKKYAKQVEDFKECLPFDF